MYKKNNTWPLSILVVVVSVLSMLVIVSKGRAVWIQPGDLPNSTNMTGHVTLTPMVQDLDLSTHRIMKTGDNNFAIEPGGPTAFKISGYGLGAQITATDNATGYGAVITGPQVGAVLIGNSNIGPTTAAIFVGKACFNNNNPSNCISSWDQAGGASYWTLTDGNISNTNSIGKVVVGNGTGQLCLNGTGASNCINSWSQAGGTPPAAYWVGSGNNVYNSNSGNVGIGTNSPNRKLHVADTGSPNNAEIDLQTGANSYWAMYHDNTSKDLRFWNNDITSDKNTLILKSNGDIKMANNASIGADPSSANRLTVYNSGDNKTGISSVITGANAYAIYGESTNAAGIAVYSKGYIGTMAQGVGANSIALLALPSGAAGSKAAQLGGDVAISGNLGVGAEPNTGSALTVSSLGSKTGVYATNSNSVANSYAVKAFGGQYGVYSQVAGITGAPTYGLYGESTAASPNIGIGVYGKGYIGVGATGVGSGSIALNVIGAGSGSKAASFTNGDVTIDAGYLQIPTNLASTGSCYPAGRLTFNFNDNKLYICNGTTWKSVQLN